MLRDELGYQGVILSDDLEMKAIAQTREIPDAAVQAIAAGCDGLLICSGSIEAQAAALEALVHAVEDGRLSYKRLEDALKRLRHRERAVSGGTGRGAGAAPQARARLRRAPAHCRGDVPVPVSRRFPPP